VSGELYLIIIWVMEVWGHSWSCNFRRC